MNLSVFSVLFIFFALSLAQKWGKEDHKHGWGRDRDKNHDRNKNHGWGHRNHSRDEDNDEEKSVFVQTSRGRIQGYVKRLPGLDPVNGVPFAEPPVGKQRFKEIEPKRPWRSTWNATFYRPACMSNTSSTTSPQKVISEDCLYVNIFADQRCSKRSPCPVIHYIHGGGYYYDSAVMFNATFIIEKYASDRIVFVIPAYRLGIFGFLDLGDDKVVTRNLGLHDIIYGIKWVRQEIKRFGGDPKKITLMGNSAGASTIAGLSIAPGVRKGSWDQVVMSSGGPDMDNVGGNQNITQKIIELAGCSYMNETSHYGHHRNASKDTSNNRTSSHRGAIQCLRKVEAINLLGYQRQLEDNEGTTFRGFSVDEKLFKGKNYNQLLARWKAVPTLIGSTKCEFPEDGMAEVCANYPKWFNYTTDAVFEACIAYYGNISDEDYSFSADPVHAEVYREARIVTQMGEKAFIYSFDLANHTRHSKDATFMIGIHQPENWTEEESLMDEYFPDMIKRFVKTGTPDRDWRPMDEKTGKNYFVLDFTLIHDTLFGPYLVDEPYYAESTKFWLYDLANVEAQAQQQINSPVYNITDIDDQNSTIPFFSLRSVMLNETDYNDTEDWNDLEPLADLYSLVEKLDTEDESVKEAWGPFWVSLSLCFVLACIILVMVVSRSIHRFKNTKGYFYNDDHGFFNEKTKIVTMNGMRYYTQ